MHRAARPLYRLFSVIARRMGTTDAAAASRKNRCAARARQTTPASHPAVTAEPVVQVYGARCLGWRGYFGIHTWIAVKPADTMVYTVYEVTYWHLRRRGSAVAIRKRVPDERWFGNTPVLLAERRGDVGALIERIDAAARDYPYVGKYVAWPGPNSNTFTAHVARAVPELRLDLPATAIGKDYLGSRLLATAPSGSGFQVSLFGLLGVLVSRVEGIEVNVLGLAFGIAPLTSGFKLPLIGRVGPTRSNISGVEAPVAADP